jgi:hypothetical protein
VDHRITDRDEARIDPTRQPLDARAEIGEKVDELG